MYWLYTACDLYNFYSIKAAIGVLVSQPKQNNDRITHTFFSMVYLCGIHVHTLQIRTGQWALNLFIILLKRQPIKNTIFLILELRSRYIQPFFLFQEILYIIQVKLNWKILSHKITHYATAWYQSILVHHSQLHIRHSEFTDIGQVMTQQENIVCAPP